VSPKPDNVDINSPGAGVGVDDSINGIVDDDVGRADQIGSRRDDGGQGKK
jgi:hypothetical protein